MIQRLADNDFYFGAIVDAFPPGKAFTTGDAGEVLHAKCGVKDAATASIYAGLVLRGELERQAHVPEATIKLTRKSVRGAYTFIEVKS